MLSTTVALTALALATVSPAASASAAPAGRDLQTISHALLPPPDPLPTAYLTHTNDLTTDPNPSMAPIRIARSIFLVDGHYNWGAVFGIQLPASWPGIRLARGSYTWTVTIYPRSDYYDIESQLSTPGHPTAVTKTSVAFDPALHGLVRVTWGGYLDPLDR
jgi:hypothetical protein